MSIGTPGGGRWIIADGGMGCYGDPEHSPTHRFHVEHWRGSRSIEGETCLSLEYALTDERMGVPAPIIDAVRQLYRDAGMEVPA